MVPKAVHRHLHIRQELDTLLCDEDTPVAFNSCEVELYDRKLTDGLIEALWRDRIFSLTDPRGKHERHFRQCRDIRQM